MATNWLDPQEMRAWRSFILTAGDLIRAIERDLVPFGLDFGDYQLLVMLSEAPDHRLRMCDLADQLRLTRSGLTRRMDGVLKKKLVTRTKSTEDGRVAFAQLTPKGFETLKNAAPHHVDSVRERLIDLMSPAELRAFSSVFGKVSERLSDERA
jgi:DNA-binding MarR family transcriptional regulator